MKTTRLDVLYELRQIEAGQKGGASEPECDHDRADGLLLDYIDDDEVREAFNAIRKWYA